MKPPAKAVWVTAVALTLVVALGIVSPVGAQSQKVDVSGGYQFTRSVDGSDSTNIPTGWYADVAGHLSSMFSLVFEVTGAYKTLTFSDPVLNSPDFPSLSTQFVSTEVNARIHTFMGGARVSAHTANPMIVPFAQVLFGAARLRASVHVSFPDTSIDESESVTKTAMHLGGGVNVMASRRVGIRAAADYRRIFFPKDEGGGSNDFLFQVGVVIPIGK
jgi:opacity protein-like surface antigen